MFSVIHLADNVRNYGPLDNVSSFPFENALWKSKRYLRKPRKPLAQLINRMKENCFILSELKFTFHFREKFLKCKNRNKSENLDHELL